MGLFCRRIKGILEGKLWILEEVGGVKEKGIVLEQT
jgi:hypothetical protein